MHLLERITVQGGINLLISIIICVLFIQVSCRGGTFFDFGATGGGKPTPGARIYHK